MCMHSIYLMDQKKTLFEYLQAQLETETENLSGLLESQIVIFDRKTLIEITSLARKRLTNLIEGVNAGLVTENTPSPSSKIQKLTKNLHSTVVSKILPEKAKKKRKEENLINFSK